jgi:hypothetical protein
MVNLNKMEYLNTKRCYCLNLNEKKIVKGDITKLWRDGFTKDSLAGVLTYSLYLSTVFDTDLRNYIATTHYGINNSSIRP